MKHSLVARFVALMSLALVVPLAKTHAGINFCIPPTPTMPCISVDTIVEMYQNGKAAPDLSNGAYVVLTPSSTTNQQGPFNVIVMGNDWNLYAIDLTGNWWKWATWTQAWSNLNTTQIPSNIGLSGVVTPPPSTTLIAEWLLTQPSISGTTVADNSGNNNVATVVSGPLPVVPLGAIFNGSSQYVQSVLVPKGTALTVGVWFNATSLTGVAGGGGGGNPRLVANSHTDVDVKGFQLMFNNGGASGFFDVGNGTAEGRASWTQQLTKGTWHYYVGVYDGSTVSAYLDGVQVASKAFAGGSIAAGTGPNINIARNPSYGADYYAGTLYDVQICQCALTAAQILTNYKAGP